LSIFRTCCFGLLRTIIRIMRHMKFTMTTCHLIPLGALLLATALGGCVAYGGYPTGAYNYPSGYYSGYPSGYYASYPRNYSYTSNARPLYSPTYYSSPSSYESNGGGGR
jgi:hypothetical protein